MLIFVCILGLAACDAQGANPGDTVGGAMVLVDASDNGTTISGLTLDVSNAQYGIKIVGAQDVIIDGCTITGSLEAGILVRDSANITIQNCTIIGGETSGIRISSADSSSNVHIINNTIKNVEKDGILVAVDDDANIRHPGLIIRDNWIENVASDLSWPGHYHGMYIQTPGYVIEDNTIVDVIDGNGISLRAGGLIQNNVVIRTGKNGISYFADHQSPDAPSITITGNTVWDPARNSLLDGGAPIAILELPSQRLSPIINSANITNNHLGPQVASESLVSLPNDPDYLTGGASVSGTTVFMGTPAF